MYNLKITTSQSRSFTLLVPDNITFYHLHCALELILCPVMYVSYSFMLMTDRCAIEKPDAGHHRIAAAFARNPVIRYRIPYPDGEAYVLELMDTDAPGDGQYPIVQGTEEDGAGNRLLRTYCTFTENWVCRNQEYFAELARDRKEAGRSARAAAHPMGPVGPEYFKNAEEKIWILDYFAGKEDGAYMMTESSPYTQAELLERSVNRETLRMYCRYAGFPAGANWRKAKLAQSFCDNLQEHIWLVMVLLPMDAMELYQKLCRLKKGQRFRLEYEEDIEAVHLFINLGMADLAMENGSERLTLELTEDFKKRFCQAFSDSVKYDRRSGAAVYLAPELRAGSWQKVVKGYTLLDDRVFRLLRYYGIMKAEDLCARLRECYGYGFTAEEFERYLMLHLRLLEYVNTGVDNRTKERYAGMPGTDIGEAFEILERYQIEPEQKPVDRAVLDDQTAWMLERMHNILEILSGCTEDPEDAFGLAIELTKAVAGNKGWIDFLDILWELLEEPQQDEGLILWYALSKAYLKLPVSGLGGYSRMEYAARHQLENPYRILNEEKTVPVYMAGGIFQKPLDVQWELFCDCSRVMEGDEIAEKRLWRNTKKALGTTAADILLMYCYVYAPGSKLKHHLEKLEKKGNITALSVMDRLNAMYASLPSDQE